MITIKKNLRFVRRKIEHDKIRQVHHSQQNLEDLFTRHNRFQAIILVTILSLFQIYDIQNT